MIETETNLALPKGSVVGWRAIGVAVGRPTRYLAQAFSDGRLPVEPMKLGHSVAMTPDQIERLRTALSASFKRSASAEEVAS